MKREKNPIRIYSSKCVMCNPQYLKKRKSHQREQKNSCLRTERVCYNSLIAGNSNKKKKKDNNKVLSTYIISLMSQNIKPNAIEN